MGVSLPLSRGLTDDDPSVRSMAAWSLGVLRDPSAIVSLEDLEEDGDSGRVRSVARWALRGDGTPPPAAVMGTVLRRRHVSGFGPTAPPPNPVRTRR